MSISSKLYSIDAGDELVGMRVGELHEGLKLDRDVVVAQPLLRQLTCTSTSGNQATPCKKRRQGRLAGFIHMPFDIFAEIALHLLPVDIISLSRSTKLFRNMLMRQSSVHIWHGAMNNLPGLPPCPHGMSEPCYMALMFSKTCSARNAEILLGEEWMETFVSDFVVRVATNSGWLRLPLVGFAVERLFRSLIPWHDVPSTIREISHCTMQTTPTGQKSSDTRYVLREDVSTLLAEYNEKKELGDNSILRAWFRGKTRNVEQQRTEADAITRYLDNVDIARRRVRSDIKVERRLEIQRRVKELGWNDEDIPANSAFEVYRSWNTLVNQPKRLTEQEWATLSPKLIHLLEANRVEYSTSQFWRGKLNRHTPLEHLFAEIKSRLIPVSSIMIGINGLFPGATTSATVYPSDVFPSLYHALAWPLVKDLYETDRTPEEMVTKFEEHRQEIENMISEWRATVRTHFIRQVDASGTSLEQTLTYNTDTSNSVSLLSGDLGRLLRADTLFYNTRIPEKHSLPLTYKSVIRQEGLSWVAYITPVETHHSYKVPHLQHIRWYPEAHEAAKALLTSVGKPDASSFEIDTTSGTYAYVCGRCHDRTPWTWEGIVQHYVKQKQKYSDVQKILESLAEQGITYELNDIHNPTLATDLPLMKPHTKERFADVYEEGLDQLQVCKVCERIPCTDRVVASQLAIIRHLLDVHGVIEPELEEHYAPKR